MIAHNRELQALECSICHEQTELMRKVQGDPFELLALKQKLQGEHRICEEYKDQPELLAAAKKMQAEERRLAERKKPRRACRTFPYREPR